MTSAMSDDRNEERRRRVLLGPLPAGFLRTDGTTDSVDADYQAALALQQQLCGNTLPAAGPPLTARLSVTIAQAKLVKNYGLTRMDPYVRMRVGHCIYETHTDPSGGKTPRWNKVVHCLLPPGVNSMYLEIFDECSFTMDELIAWVHITIPPAVLNGETHEDWYPLNGKQGDGVEGMINLVLSYSMRNHTNSAPVSYPVNRRVVCTLNLNNVCDVISSNCTCYMTDSVVLWFSISLYFQWSRV
ncbi:toll-interacting protein-like isoform X1 [Achroia grisella]|uniref:toll-interacting protein-like isoform X1 n=1 Tax=Achroia grisella TaxID=688607 RepID=UPI0027D2456F|nr:toll-interacting protein-like isoform X1 [Achroia grisella]